ncbi:Pectinesterase, active site-containing protein [Artemisia annua]|uniref:pectinesterase n=1 Tax=Artemisia annua TaxID=35608 RepID=A0A2U1LD13_ARTAN|nr:Pectinesterase, active site-containing protein [Artemisia annua]
MKVGPITYINVIFKDLSISSLATLDHSTRNSEQEDIGFSFVNCSVTGNEGAIYLGRAWENYLRMVYSYCDIDNIIDPSGWSDWNQPSRQRDAMFGEYECRGKGADTRNRVWWSKSLGFVEATPFLDTHFIDGEDWIT